ncbi:MAG: hypothetical protein ACRD2L_23355 [Terriglobia bacterium]
MTFAEIETEIHQHLQRLPLEQQRHVLEIVRALAAARAGGVPESGLLRFAGTIDPRDIAAMNQAIQDGCEKIHGDDW